MFVQTLALVSFLQVFIPAAQADGVWNGFSASWDLIPSAKFYVLPQTLEAAQDEGWTEISGVNPSDGATALGYKGDPTFVILFAKGVATGFELAFPVSEVENTGQPMRWSESEAIITKTIDGELFYTATMLFSNDESTNVREIWLQEKNGLRKIPTNTSQLISETDFLLKNCIPTMGTHYYTWNSNSDCINLYPWFFMGEGEEVHGVGFQGIGNLTTRGTRKWWENIPATAVRRAVPDAASCIVDGIEQYGGISIHTWFRETPYKITCG